MLNRRVHDRTTHLNEKYERLTADYEKLCQIVIEIRSHMDDPCAPPYWIHSPGDDQPSPPLSPTPPLF